MNTATYKIDVTLEGGKGVVFERTMPTRPTTSKGRKSQNDRLCSWVEREFPTYTRYEITPLY